MPAHDLEEEKQHKKWQMALFLALSTQGIKGVNLFLGQFISEQTGAISVLATGRPAATLPS